MQVIKEHMAPITSVAFVPEEDMGSEILITSAGDWTVRMWARDKESRKFRATRK